MIIVKNCSKHGDLTIEHCFIRTEKRWGNQNKQAYSCKQCKKESSDKYRNRPEIRVKLIEKSRNDHIKFRDKERIRKKKYCAKNRERINLTEKLRRHKNQSHFRELMRNQQKKWRDSLDDNYVKAQLRAKYNIPQKDIPQWLVDFKREIIRLRREIRRQETNEDN